VSAIRNAQVDSVAVGPGGFEGLSDMWSRILTTVGSDMAAKLILSLLMMGIVLGLRRAALRIVDLRVEDRTLHYRWAKGIGYGSSALVVLSLFQIWFKAVESVGTFLGLVSAGLAIALKDLVGDFAGWVFIVWRRPFEVGDRLQIGGVAGDVVDIRIFQFTVLEIGNWVSADQSTGRLVHIPNAQVFTQSLANYTAGFPYLWNELEVLVTFESDWRLAKKRLAVIAAEDTAEVSEEAGEQLRKKASRFLIHYQNLTPTVYTAVRDSGIALTVRYLCRPRQRRSTAERLWERILDMVAEEPAVDLAYPTQRFYLHAVEGKEGLRAPIPGITGRDSVG